MRFNRSLLLLTLIACNASLQAGYKRSAGSENQESECSNCTRCRKTSRGMVCPVRGGCTTCRSSTYGDMNDVDAVLGNPDDQNHY
jgi:hypothetical protein